MEASKRKPSGPMPDPIAITLDRETARVAEFWLDADAAQCAEDAKAEGDPEGARLNARNASLLAEAADAIRASLNSPQPSREAEVWRCPIHGPIEPRRWDSEWPWEDEGTVCPVFLEEDFCGRPVTPEPPSREQRLEEALPDPAKLRLLADWFDREQEQRWGDSTEVQDDLRRWADAAAAALSPDSKEADQ